MKKSRSARTLMRLFSFKKFKFSHLKSLIVHKKLSNDAFIQFGKKVVKAKALILLDIPVRRLPASAPRLAN